MKYNTKWIASIIKGEAHPTAPGGEGGGGLSHLDGIPYEMDCLNNLWGSPPIHAGQGGGRGRFVSFELNTIRNGLPQ